MAARSTTLFSKTFNREQNTITAKCVGNAGANPTNVRGLGVASITWVSTGKYLVTLQDKWNALLQFEANVLDSTGAKHFRITPSAEDVATGKTITFEVFAGATTVAPTRADLAATETLMLTLTLSNTAQKPNGN